MVVLAVDTGNDGRAAAGGQGNGHGDVLQLQILVVQRVLNVDLARAVAVDGRPAVDFAGRETGQQER